MNSNSYIEIFGGREDPKPADKPKPALFSGLAMKKTTKVEPPVQSAYVPPVTDIKPVEAYSYKPPDPETIKTVLPSKTPNDTESVESTENTRSNEDPFADIRLVEEIKIQKAAKIPGFADDDNTEDNFDFVKKNKLNLLKNEDPVIKQSGQRKFLQNRIEEKKTQESPSYAPAVSISASVQPRIQETHSGEGKAQEVLRVIPAVNSSSSAHPRVEENHNEDKKVGEKSENRLLKGIEEKLKREAEEKANKEREERQRIEEILRKEQETKEKEELAKRQKLEEDRKIYEQYGDPYALKELVRTSLDSFSRSISEKIKAQEGLKAAQQDLLSGIKTMQAKITELEELEDGAAYMEEFEEAAKFHEELEELKEACKVNHERIQNNSAQYSQLETEKNAVLLAKKTWIEETFETSRNVLSKVKENLENDRDASEELRKSKAEEYKSRWSQVTDKEEGLQKIKSNVNDKRSELEQRIYEKSSVIQNEEKELSGELRALSEEIAELEAKLAKKKAQALDLSTKLSVVKETLSKSMKEFEEEANEVEEAEKVIKTDIERTDALKSQLEQEQHESNDQYESFMRKYTTKLSDLEVSQQELDLLELEIRKMASLQENRSKFLEEIKEIEKTLKEKEELLWDAQEYYSSIKDSIDQFKEFIRLQEEKVKEIDKKIPLLENDKKAAASAKQFKVGGI